MAKKSIPINLVRFVIIDDRPFIRRIVTDHLKSCGIDRFSYAQDGGDGLNLLKLQVPKMTDAALVDLIDARPDIAGDLYPESEDFKAAHSHCVITDFAMPNFNGLQLIKAIRCGETRIARSAPVILLTGYSDDFVVTTALQLDVSAFVLKPISRNILWEKVQRVLKAEPTVKSVEEYAKVEIPDEEGNIIGANTKRANPDIMTSEDENNIRLVPLGAVQPGAVLAADLFGEKGTLLLRQGTVFDKGLLQKIADLEGMKRFKGGIPIKNPPEAAADTLS